MLVALVFHQTSACLHKTLAQDPEISLGFPPHVFECLVGFKETAGVEQFDPELEGFVHVGMIAGI